jgi:electron transfer flavoprotein alpha subunit
MKKLERDDSRQGEVSVETIAWDESKFAVTVLEEVKEVSSCDKIEDAKILVSCGRGVKDVCPARELAGKVGGSLSSSRALVDTGVLEHNRQVGQTGKTVRPEAYLAFGISGAIQHLAGMEESEFIVAVNTDKNAPIFKVANLGIVSDASAVLKNLNKLL